MVTEGKFLGEGAAAQLAAWIVRTYVCWNSPKATYYTGVWLCPPAASHREHGSKTEQQQQQQRHLIVNQ